MDLIADAICILKNGSMVGLEFVDIARGNRSIDGVLSILQRHGFIGRILKRRVHGQPQFRVFLKKTEKGAPFINNTKRMSSPGRRKYVNKKNIPYVMGGVGLGIISTSKGIMSFAKAQSLGIGGEILCCAW
ncbi:MAG: 30S ribosomal protein S8 [Chlamydiia bacterium]|nr:30S ribosomal protein S8 [Chlamydiia bacterium]